MEVVPKVRMVPEGLCFSKIVQGYWRMAEWGLDKQECLSFIKQHVELGISTVDHAHVYGDPPCEELFGQALKLDPSLRDRIEIISKCGIVPGNEETIAYYRSDKNAIITSVETSLSRLGVDHLDVLLIHRPDYLMNGDEIANAFAELKADGKVKYFGVSNFNVEQFDLLQSRLRDPLVTNQIELNPVNHGVLESGMLERMQRDKVYPMAWSCLGGGRIFTEESDKMQRLRKVLQEIVDELNASSIDQVVYAWVLKMPSNPILTLGTRDMSRIEKAVASLAINMTHKQWYRILTASRGYVVA